MAREHVPVLAGRFSSILDLFSGNFSRRFLVRTLVPLMYLCLFSCLLVAGLLFPPSPQGGPGYIPFAQTISGLGDRADNPFGAWFFTIGIIITSILMVPFSCYTWRQLSAINKAGAGFILFLMIGGAIGFAMVSIWDEESNCIAWNAAGNCLLVSHQVHDIASGIAFLGNLFAVLFALFPMIADKRRTGQDRFGIMWQLIHIVTFIVMIVIGLIFNKDFAMPDFFRQYAFWEWLVFVGLVIYYISLAIRLPGDTGKNEVIS
ncbi:MAG TPA: DUF998 domain-containing protein [Candidatus Lokiarchaeia archaeon]|nr:DUF998 domain-containing protein [Candidatus Lokiarchaeia archaeon]